MSRHETSPCFSRRGIAVISFVAALLVIGTLALWLFQLTASSSISSLGHLYSTGAFYAAESGLEMALREIEQASDLDGDASDSGVPFGTISDNGIDADDPTVATGAVYVEQWSASPETYRAIGRPTHPAAPWSTFRRTVEIRTP